LNSENLYITSFIEQNLGLPAGILDEFSIPDNLAHRIISSVRGDEQEEVENPTVERMLNFFMRDIGAYAMSEYGFFAFKERWPNGADYAVALTHDVDNIDRPLSHILKIRKRFRFYDIILHILHLRSLYRNLDYTAKVESKYGLKSTFFVMASNYDLKEIAKDVGKLKELGWEFALHGGEGTHESKEKMMKEIDTFASKLGFRPIGVREHFLKFDFEKTWKILEDCHLSYDSSIGTRDKLGFRIGLCTPFHPPDSSWNMMRITEVPLVLMDTTLWGYMKRNEDEGMNDFMRLKDAVHSVNGLFTILWHTESLRMKGGRIYPKILENLKRDNSYINNVSTILNFWERRNMAKLKIERRKLRLEGAFIGLTLRLETLDKKISGIKGGYIEENDGYRRVFPTSEVLEVSFE
jgi:peptidoglycan/xylan/chitin deacetylase (PgdA/CDA1 family)